MYPQYKKFAAVSISMAVALSAAPSLFAQEPPQEARDPERNRILEEADQDDSIREVSPVRRIDRDTPRRQDRQPRPDGDDAVGFRSFDGSGNNVANPTMGATLTWLSRWAPSDYADGVEALAGENRPSARVVSNTVAAKSELIPNSFGTTDFLWQWGQFLDHDLDLTDGVEPAEHVDIEVPAGDPWFDPNELGTVVISFNRALYDPGTGIDTPRQQVNEITAWIDASNVYGSDEVRAMALRTLDGTGRLNTSEGDLLPFNTLGLANAGGNSAELFVAGDVRANEQIGLTVMHTLFVREHNRLADLIAAEHPELDGEEIYQRARRLVGAEMQIITYQEYLPALLGEGALDPYRGYDPEVDGSISHVFAAASYRYGHTALSPTLLRLDRNGNEIAAGHLPLRNAFFAPQEITETGGIAPFLRGLASQAHQEIDPFLVDDVRNFLFGAPGAGGFDLVSLNIQRGRDHGLPGYNDMREAMGMRRLGSGQFSGITRDREVQERLRDAYGSVNEIDAWVGGLAEDPVDGAQVGPLIFAVLTRQFEALRDGDRFWWERTLTREERGLVEELRLVDIIRFNTEIEDEIQEDVFWLVSAN